MCTKYAVTCVKLCLNQCRSSFRRDYLLLLDLIVRFMVMSTHIRRSTERSRTSCEHSNQEFKVIRSKRLKGEKEHLKSEVSQLVLVAIA